MIALCNIKVSAIFILEITLLIEKCKRNNYQAQTKLYERFGYKWYSICLRYVSSKQDADDIMQEILIKIYAKLDKYDPSKGAFEAWSHRICVNECLMHLRKRNKLKVNLDDLEITDLPTKENIIDNLSTEELLKIIQSMPEGYRSIFNMYVIEGYSHKEIAEMLEISEGTSKSQLYYAKAFIKRKLKSIWRFESNLIPIIE